MNITLVYGTEHKGSTYNIAQLFLNKLKSDISTHRNILTILACIRRYIWSSKCNNDALRILMKELLQFFKHAWIVPFSIKYTQYSNLLLLFKDYIKCNIIPNWEHSKTNR